MVAASPFDEFEFEGQRVLDAAPWTGTASEGLRFPLALQARAEIKSVDDAVRAIEGLVERDELLPLLNLHGGALLFRGMHPVGPEDFSRLAAAFKLGTPHEELGNPVIRHVLAKHVSTANEGPPTHHVFPHNEFGWSLHYPAYLLFMCRQAAESGGSTPINSGAEMFARLQAEVPEFIAQLVAKGTRYTYRYPADTIPGSSNGNSITRAYPSANLLPTDDEETRRAKVEPEIKKHSNDWTWNDDGSLNVVHRLTSIRRHPYSSLPIYFGNITSHYLKARSVNALEPPFLGTDGAHHHLPQYGDGTPIPQEYLQKTADIIDDIRVLLPWQNGDFILMDNHLIQHAREPWVGERRVLASLWDGPAALPY